MFFVRYVFAATLIAFSACPLFASITRSTQKRTWSLVSGPVEYRLAQQGNDGGVVLRYFGPKGAKDWTGAGRPEIDGVVDGQWLRPGELELTRQEIVAPESDHAELHLVFKHKRLPLEVEEVYTTFGDTGVITRKITLRNTGSKTLMLEKTPSLALLLPGDAYDVTYLHGTWGEERQVANAKLTFAGLELVNRTGRSTAEFSPWFVLHGAERGVRYAAQLAYSGNWQMAFQPVMGTRHQKINECEVGVSLGMRYDFGGDAKLAAGSSFALPEVAFTADKGDLDDVANHLHRYQRQYVFAHTPTNSPPLIIFNTWQMMRRNPTAAEVKKYADLIAPLGIEGLVIDSGWFRHPHTPKPDSPIDPKAFPLFGDWEAEPQTFPKGLLDVSDYVHSKGMKFGVWVEIETVSLASETAHKHPDWIMTYNGKPLMGGANRAYLNFANPAARAWARGVFERLITQDKVDWFKLDYNVNLGEMFDPSSTDARTGTVLHDHLMAYYSLLDEVRAAHPNVVLENCSSGGRRADLGILRHMHTSWTSDVIEPKRNAQLDYGCTMEFAPEICEHWMVGDANGTASGDAERGEVYATDSREWMETMVRLPMAGQMGFSSLVGEWPPMFRDVVIKGIEDYKRIRPVIAQADTYHLTPPPEAGSSPHGWLGLEFVQPDAARAVVLAVRMGNGVETNTLHLRGLNAKARYTVISNRTKIGSYTGAELAEAGLPVKLTKEWNSALIEVNRE